MNTKKNVIIIISVLLLILLPLLSSFCFFYIMSLAMETDVVEKTVATPYGDKFYIEYREGSVGFQPTEVNFKVLYNGESVIDTDRRFRDYTFDVAKRMHVVMRMCAEGEDRAYEFNWGIVYTTDDGKSFKGALQVECISLYRTDEEFARIYEMLYNGNPFYDKRFDEHLDMNKQELPDIQTAEYAMEYAKSVRKERYVHISEIESLVGKAQRCILVFMSDDGRKVNNVSLEYDLSNGQILVMEYSNMSNNDEIDLYVTLFMVRDLYVPEEWGAPQVLARLKQALF